MQQRYSTTPPYIVQGYGISAWVHYGSAAQRLVALIKDGPQGWEEMAVNIDHHLCRHISPPRFLLFLSSLPPPRTLNCSEADAGETDYEVGRLWKRSGKEGEEGGEEDAEKKQHSSISSSSIYSSGAFGVWNNTCPQGDHSRISAHADVLIPFTFHLQGKPAFSRKKGRLPNPLHGQQHVFNIMLSPTHTHHCQVIECTLQLDRMPGTSKDCEIESHTTVAKLLIIVKMDMYI